MSQTQKDVSGKCVFNSAMRASRFSLEIKHFSKKLCTLLKEEEQ